MNDEMQKWSQRFESQNGRQPTTKELASAKKRITRNMQVQQTRPPRPTAAQINEQLYQERQQQQKDAPVNNRFAWLWVIGLPTLFIIGGILAFIIGSAHGKTLF